MKTHTRLRNLSVVCLLALEAFVLAPNLFAHCDALDGPVVRAAQRALAERNVNYALIWVRQEEEPEIKRVFEGTLVVRQLGPEAKELADLYFFETLVRLHRAGEGEPYTGLKPAGRDLGPAIPAGDKALETGNIAPVLTLLSGEIERGIHEHFTEASEKKNFSPDDVDAGRAYVRAYVTYIHYVDGVHQAATSASSNHPGEPAKPRDEHAEHRE